MKDLRKQPEEEKADDHHHQRQTMPPPLVLDQTPSMNVVTEPTPLTSTTDRGILEGFYDDIFDVLSDIDQLSPTLPPLQPEEAFILGGGGSSSHDPEPQIFEKGEYSIGQKDKCHVPQIFEKGESSGQKDKSNVPQSTQCDFTQGDKDDCSDSRSRDQSHDQSKRSRSKNNRDSSRNRESHRSNKSRSMELHNMTERIRRNRIRKKLQTLQDMVPNCNTRDNASILEDAVKHIKSLQDYVKMMSAAGYPMVPMVPTPQNPTQFMPMNPSIGMGMELFNVFPSSNVPVIPFALPGPSHPTLATSGTTMAGTIHQSQLPLNPFGPAVSADSTLMAPLASFPSLPPTIVYTTVGENSSQSVPQGFEFSQVPVMSQGPGNAMVLPSQIIAPTSSSSSSSVAE